MAGKSAKLKEFKDDLKGNIIDINEDDMKVETKHQIEEEKTSKYIFSGQPNRLDDEGDDSRTGSQAFRQGSKGERWSSAVS